MTDGIQAFKIGKIAGFLIVRNGSERLEFATAELLQAELTRVDKISREFWEKHPGGCLAEEYTKSGIPADEFYTLIRRDDDGEIEKSEGFCCSHETGIGTAMICRFCVGCGSPDWSLHEEGRENIRVRCVVCTMKDTDEIDDAEVDEEAYLRRLEPEY